ncbi:hypothetical protein LCGC14_1150010 [marine sediment metagenome]|uniref:Uncharacterized protein n=1 Tax=marine sediment metagenome TaxID=412755 RepID=A0A0F9M0N3_9ZZZZ
MDTTFAAFAENMDKLWWRLFREDSREGRDPNRNSLRGMIVLEQRMLRSRKLIECIECGDPGTTQHESILVKSVPHYFMCIDCDACWKGS